MMAVTPRETASQGRVLCRGEHDLEVPSDAALGTDCGQQWVKQKASGCHGSNPGKEPWWPGSGGWQWKWGKRVTSSLCPGGRPSRNGRWIQCRRQNKKKSQEHAPSFGQTSRRVEFYTYPGDAPSRNGFGVKIETLGLDELRLQWQLAIPGGQLI